MIVTIFRSRVREEALDEYREAAERTLALARAQPGFHAIKTFAAADGERVSIVEFESQEDHAAWRDHPEHRQVKALGIERFYSDYSIQVCEPHLERRWERATD